jgi:hypothetical protein
MYNLITYYMLLISAKSFSKLRYTISKGSYRRTQNNKLQNESWRSLLLPLHLNGLIWHWA